MDDLCALVTTVQRGVRGGLIVRWLNGCLNRFHNSVPIYFANMHCLHPHRLNPGIGGKPGYACVDLADTKIRKKENHGKRSKRILRTPE